MNLRELWETVLKNDIRLTEIENIGMIKKNMRFIPPELGLLLNLKEIHFNDNKFKRLDNFCKSNGLNYQFFDKSSEAKIENWLDSIKPEIIVVYSMSHLLSKRIFSKPKYGAINLHPSLLPSYRGPNPYFWMYYYMEEKGGVTVHHLDENEDTGDIVFQREYDIRPGVIYPELVNKSVEIGASLLKGHLMLSKMVKLLEFLNQD